MADADPQIPPALAVFAAKMAARPVVPATSDQQTLHVGIGDLPWLEAGDGSALQLLHVDLNQGIWIANNRLPPGYKVIKHYHTGQVYAVTHQGRWFYAESPEAMNSPGSYLYEPAGSVHTLCTPADQQGDTIAWFAVHGANVNLDADGNILSVFDARAVLDIYRGWCDAMGHRYDALIVIGE
ncbi:2,4'-dihydroxyacetophenone dioxygenase family protein [Glacieibacterium frigidum]|uniref:Cupin n=1 Tax=Glacieibacterium frigidum TaxID=2593303 RepID=A0A552U9P4_9SPHN|nr:2,4'-dihydroxyacetophenone dioxygenase family protein [Glacieibacterium frigidum]TRW14941.1 cupin [Glacieibacterium frigidum]